jgi:plasmid maintenance system killer protein
LPIKEEEKKKNRIFLIRTAPTAAMEVLLGLPSLHLQVEAEVKVGNYRLRCNGQWKLKFEGFDHVHMTQDNKKSILQIWSDKMIPRHVYRSEWKEGFSLTESGH